MGGTIPASVNFQTMESDKPQCMLSPERYNPFFNAAPSAKQQP